MATKLSIELVPRTCWYSNLRSVLPSQDWDRLRRSAYETAGYRCEICGGVGPRHPVEAHERWVYDDSRHVQLLDGLWALCPTCHSVKHLGRTSAVSADGGAAARRHLAAVNGWTSQDTDLYIEGCFEIWSQRSAHEWDLDIGWLTRQGIAVPVRHERHA